MGRGDSWDDDDRRWQRRRYDGNDVGDISINTRRSPRSGAVTSVAVLNLIAGPFVMFIGLCGAALKLMPGAGDELLGVPGLSQTSLASTVLGLGLFGWAVGCLVAGIGLVCRAGWSRMFTLILGGFAALAGILSLALTILVTSTPEGSAPGGNGFYVFRYICQSVFFLGYCFWAYAVLLNPRFLADFRR